MIFENFAFSSPLFPFLFVSFSMDESRGTSGFLSESSILDNPSILSKLITNDAMENLTGIVEEDFNLDEDDPKFFVICLMNL